MENAESADKLCNGRRQRQLLHFQAKYLSNLSQMLSQHICKTIEDTASIV